MQIEEEMTNYKLSGPEYPTRQMQKSLSKQKVFYIRGDRNTLWCKSGDHTWVQKLCKDFGLRYAAVAEEAMPTYATAACGIHVVGKVAHERSCNSCRRINGFLPRGERIRINRSKPGQESNGAVTVVSVPGLQEFSIDGMIAILRERYESAMEIAHQYDAAITAITRMGETQQRLSELQAQIEKDREAIQFFMKEQSGT
jgi:hypothetical protein